MKLYNQTKNALSWNLSLTRFTCEPYGEVEVPDILVEHCKVRGLPLAVTPVVPEVRAARLAEGATDAAKRDEVTNLHKQLTESVAAEKLAKIELEKKLAEIVALEQEKAGLGLDLKNCQEKYKKLIDDEAALTKLFEEQAKELEIKKQEAIRSLAVIDELKKPVIKEPQVPDKAVKNK